MALTKIPSELSSTTGIVDNSNATAITIDSSENVGIGTASPNSYPVASNLVVDAGTNGGITVKSGTSNYGGVYFADGTTGNEQYRGFIQYNHNYAGSTDALLLGTAGTEHMRIDASGNVQVKGGNELRVYRGDNATYGSIKYLTGSGGLQLNDTNGDGISFVQANGATEYARIDSSGNLLVGTTTSSVTNANGIQMLKQVGATKPRLNIATSGYTSTDYPLSIWSTCVSAWRFYVQADGRISAVYTTINSLSDERVKENIRDLDDGLSKVMQLQPRKFDWKEGKGKNITNDRGFIAQEFEQVFPDLVSEWKDEAPEGEEPYKSVSADLIPTLVKAIQEQQTLIESLTTRIAALEE